MTEKRSKDKSPSTVRRTLYYYWGVTKTQWPMFLLSVLTTLGFVFFLSYANPYIMGKVVDLVGEGSVSPDKVFEVFGSYIIMFVAANILGQLSSKLQDYSVWKLEIKANYDLATHAFDTLSNQSMTFHSNRFGGSLVSQTQKFLNGYSVLVEALIYAVIPIVAAAVFTVSMLVKVVPLYVAILVVLLIVYVIAAYFLYKRALTYNEQASAAQSALSGELSDSITNILAVKTAGREKYERALFDDANKDVLEADSRRMRTSNTNGFITSGIIILIMVVLVFFITGGNAWFGISAGTLVMMFTYTYQLTMQFNRINLTFSHINRGFGEAHDMTVILDEPTLVADDPDAAELKVTDGAILFDDLNFWYDDAGEGEVARKRNKVFSDFTLDIPAGQRIGLVGRSGSGKTTLTTLLLRLSNIQEGRILIDGQDIAHVTQVSLRQQIAYVPQEPLLFHRTVRENIAYGKPNATEAEVRAAAEKANALEFIEKLPAGFETLTGERGVKLSGGQRQRIAIARAILMDAPILVLDEATSALDSESEKLIQDALTNLMEGRTSIVVAHRLSTVASLDRIIVLADGTIAEDGTHAQLIENDGEYAQLWNRQSGAFLGDE